MKDLTRNLVVMTLLFLFIFSAFSGALIPIADAVKDMDTPVAAIENDTYHSYYDSGNFYDSFRSDIESMGGYVYDSTVEEKSKKKTTALDYEFQPIKQVITVKTTATGSKENGNYVESKPLANAIVRINGVPRFTDRNGQVRATLDREYVELFVEKNDYGPYIEIMEVTGEEKTVYLKKASDNIDIYGVMLTDIEYDPVNLINSEYTIFPEALGDYIANMKFLVNVKADRYMLLMDSEVIYSSNENIIYDIDFTDDMEGKKFYAQVEYQEILSEPVLLNLDISIPEFYKEEDIEAYSSRDGGLPQLNPFDGQDEHGIFGNFNFDLDLGKLMNLNKLLNSDNKVINFKLALDMRNSTIYLTIGFDRDKEISTGDKDKQDYKATKDKIKGYKEEQKNERKKRNEKQKEINDATNEYRERKKRYDKSDKVQEARLKELETQIKNLETEKRSIETQNIEKINKFDKEIAKANHTMQLHQQNMKNKQDIMSDLINKKNQLKTSKKELVEQIKAFGGDIKDARKAFEQKQGGLICGVEVIGTLGYNYKFQKISKVAISVDGEIGFQVDGRFMIGYVPLFYTIKIKAGLHIEMNLIDDENGFFDITKLNQYILLGIDVAFEGELGVGINHLLNVRFFVQAKYGISGYVFMPEFYTDQWKEFLGSEFDMGVGIRATVFFLPDFEIGYGHNFKKDPKLPGYILDEYNKRQEISIRMAAQNLENLNILDNNIYDGSKPQIEKVGDDYVASWIDMEIRNGEPRSVLKYSVYSNGNWGVPKEVYGSGSDFYHDTYFDGKDLHVTWQNIKEGTDITSLEDMCKNSEIYYAKYDSELSQFVDVRQVSDNATLDMGPKFALQESADQPLTIVWQKNSAEDLIGLNGRNSIVYSTFDAGNWSVPNMLYESDNYFSFVNSAYVDSKLTSAFVEDMDNDLTTDDRKIIVCAEGVQCKIVGSDFEIVNNPQFFKIDGKTRLTFHADGNVRFTDDYVNVNKFDIADGKINDTYQIMDDGNEIYVYYYKVGSDNSPQAYASIYDKSTDSWQVDVRLTSAKNKVTSPSIAILPGGDILTVYNSLDRETQLVSLEWDIKHIRKDFEIAYVLYDLDAKSGEKINLNIGIKNIGDYVIRSVDVFAFGQMNTIVFDNAVEIGEFATIKVEREFSISADGQEIITVRFDDIVRQYMLTTRFTDVSIDGVRRIDKEREYYDLILKNSSEEASKVYLDIYYNGELIDTTEMFLSGNETLTYTYFNDEFVNGGYVYFEIRTEMADKYESDNSISFCVEYMVEKEPVKINPYYQSMQIAKYL